MQEMYQKQQQQQFLQQLLSLQEDTVTQHAMVVQVPMGDCPINTTCLCCHSNIITSVKTQPSAYTHFLAGMLCLMCCCLCAWMPYFSNSAQSSIHTCPNCAAYIGTDIIIDRYHQHEICNFK